MIQIFMGKTIKYYMNRIDGLMVKKKLSTYTIILFKNHKIFLYKHE